MTKQKRLFLGILCTIGVILIIASAFCYWTFFVNGTIAPTQSIHIAMLSVSNEGLTLKGTTSDSATGFSGYDYKIKGNTLMIWLRYCLVSRRHPSGDFDISIRDDLKDVQFVVIQGKVPSDKMPIWERSAPKQP